MAVFTAQPGTVEQVQAFDTLRIIYGEACGDPTSQRIAHEGYLRIAQGIEKASDIENMCADIETFWSEGRFAKTRQIRRIDQILFAQAGHQQGPRFGRGPKAMNGDQGSTSSDICTRCSASWRTRSHTVFRSETSRLSFVASALSSGVVPGDCTTPVR